MSTQPSRDTMVAAFLASDGSYDGVFFTAVKTTGIFCRPACPARKPLPGNVEFFATVREAMFAGYRACKRCTPLEAPGKPPEWASNLIARLEDTGRERAVAQAHAKPFVVMGKAMREYVAIGDAPQRKQSDVAVLMKTAFGYARGLAPKIKKPSKAAMEKNVVKIKAKTKATKTV